eukprot:829384-Rhodomonas_salina.1
MHLEEPLVALKLPAGHATHCPPSGPVYPGTQRQSVTSALPIRELDRFPAGHARQTMPALSLRYVPGAHSMHSDDPLI